MALSLTHFIPVLTKPSEVYSISIWGLLEMHIIAIMQNQIIFNWLISEGCPFIVPVQCNKSDVEECSGESTQCDEAHQIAPDHTKDPLPHDAHRQVEGQNGEGHHRIGNRHTEDEAIACILQVRFLVNGVDDDHVEKTRCNGYEG